MPIVEAHIPEGCRPKQKLALAEALKDAVSGTTHAKMENITVMLHEHRAEPIELSKSDTASAGRESNSEHVVRGYLAAMESRAIEEAQAMLAEDFEMVFPGTDVMTKLEELLQWAAGRYRFVKKHDLAVESFKGTNADVVYVRGTLAGEWSDGNPFADIRFIDRFEIHDGKITRQDVWNDIAEVRAQ